MLTFKKTRVVFCRQGSQFVIALLLAALSGGCTAISLKRHTLNQAESITDLRYQQTVNNLALVAHNPGALPSISIFASGISTQSDSCGIDPATTWDHNVSGFAKQALGFPLNCNPDQSWQLDPVVTQPQLAAFRAAFSWVVFGAPAEGSPEMEILRAPKWDDKPGVHFGIADKLATLPTGWLHVGKKSDVPHCARYKAHCGCTYVWVTPDGMKGLSEFTLIVLDISTLDLNAYRFRSAGVTVKRKIDGKRITEQWEAYQPEPKCDACCHPCMNREECKENIGAISIKRPSCELCVPDINAKPKEQIKAFARSQGLTEPTGEPREQTPEPRQYQSSQMVPSRP